MRRHARAAGRLNRPPWARPVAPLPAGCRPAPWRGTAVGGRQPLGQGRRVVLVLRQPDADGGRDAQAVDAAGQRLGETPGHVLAQRDGAAGVVAGQHGGEFLAADAGQQHRRPQHAARDVGEGLEHQIAGLVAVAVVDGLELVGRRPARPAARAPAAVDQALALLEEPAAVAQPGQVVGLRFPQQLAMRLFAHQLEQRHGQHDGIQHAFVHGDIAGQHLRGRAIPGHPPGQDEAAAQVEQRVQAGHGHRDAQRQQRSQRLTAQQLPGGQAADQRDGKGADIGPDRFCPE